MRQRFSVVLVSWQRLRIQMVWMLAGLLIEELLLRNVVVNVGAAVDGEIVDQMRWNQADRLQLPIDWQSGSGRSEQRQRLTQRVVHHQLIHLVTGDYFDVLL